MNDALKGAMVGKLAVVGRRWRGGRGTAGGESEGEGHVAKG